MPKPGEAAERGPRFVAGLGKLLPEGEVITIGLTSVGAILGVDLMAHTSLLPEFGKKMT